MSDTTLVAHRFDGRFAAYGNFWLLAAWLQKHEPADVVADAERYFAAVRDRPKATRERIEFVAALHEMEVRTRAIADRLERSDR